MNIDYIRTHLPYLIYIVYALVILVVGIIAALIMRRMVDKYFKTQNVMLKNFLGTLVFTTVLILTIVSALSKLGVPTASLIAVMGAAGLAIALSLKDSLSNIAAGFLIVFLKPFKVGDFVRVNGDSGSITNINLFLITLKTATNECLFIPNNKVLSNSVLNYSYYDIRRNDLSVGVGYDSDLSRVKQVILEVLANNAAVLKDPAPLVGVEELADSSINMLVRYWTPRVDLFQSKLDLLEHLNNELTKAGIEIPFPQLDLNMKSSDKVS